MEYYNRKMDMPATQNAISMAQFPEPVIEWIWEPQFVKDKAKAKDLMMGQMETMKNRKLGK